MKFPTVDFEKSPSGKDGIHLFFKVFKQSLASQWSIEWKLCVHLSYQLLSRILLSIA